MLWVTMSVIFIDSTMQSLCEYSMASVCCYGNMQYKNTVWPEFAKPYFCISEFYIPKAWFCSNTNAVLQNSFRVTRLDNKRSNTLALYAFLRQLILQVFIYIIITYGWFNIQSWNKDHLNHYEMVIPRFIR